VNRRFVHALRRALRKKRGAGGGGGGSPAITPANVTQASNFSGSRGFSSTDSSLMPALTNMTLCGMFIAHDPGSTTRFFSKGAGSSNGWSVNLIATGDGRLQIRRGGATVVTYKLTTTDHGKTFAFIYTVDATNATLYLVRADDYRAVWSNAISGNAMQAAGGTAVTGTAAPTIGGYQTGSAGTLTQPFQDAIIACGYGNQTLTEAQAITLGEAMVSQGTVPTDSSFPGAQHVYQASGAGGLGIDQMGNGGDLPAVGSVTYTSDVIPAYSGKRLNRILLFGQSNCEGDTPFGEFAALTADTYTAALAACEYWTWGDSAFGSLDDSGAAQGTGCEVALGRAMVAAGLANPQIVKFGVFGTSAHTDWEPTSGTQYGQLKNTLKPDVDSKTEVLDRAVTNVVWIQGENDANDETNSLAYATNEAAIMDAILTDFADWIDTGSFVWVSSKLSASYQTGKTPAWLANVNTGKETNATARSYVKTLDTEACVGNVSDDNLHFGAGSLCGIGNAAWDAINLGADQTVVVVT
jgi:hypothetical protein